MLTVFDNDPGGEEIKPPLTFAAQLKEVYELLDPSVATPHTILTALNRVTPLVSPDAPPLDRAKALIVTNFIFESAIQHQGVGQNILSLSKTLLSPGDGVAVALAADTPDYLTEYIANEILEPNHRRGFALHASKANDAYTSQWRLVQATLNDPNTTSYKAAFALALALAVEDEEEQNCVISLLHPKWQRDLLVVKTCFEAHSWTMPGALSILNKIEREKHPGRLEYVVANALADGEDPRASSALREIIEAPLDRSDFLMAFNSAVIQKPEWLEDALIASVHYCITEKKSLYSQVRWLGEHGTARSIPALRASMGALKPHSEEWYCAAWGLARLNQYDGLQAIERGAKRNHMMLRSTFRNQQLLDFIRMDTTGELTSALWSGLYANETAFNPAEVIEIERKMIGGKYVIPRKEIDELILKNLTHSKPTPFRIATALEAATCIGMEVPDETLASIVRRGFRRSDVVANLAQYLVNHLEQELPLTKVAIEEHGGKFLRRSLLLCEQARTQRLNPEDLIRSYLRGMSLYAGILSNDAREFHLNVTAPFVEDRIVDPKTLNAYFCSPQNRQELYDCLERSIEHYKSADVTVAANLQDYLCALQQAAELGILSPFRFRPSTLLRLIEMRQYPGRFKDMPKVFMPIARADWNGSFLSIGLAAETYMNNGYAVAFYEIEDKEALVESFEDFRVEYGKARTIWPGAHSSPKLMQYVPGDKTRDLNVHDIATLLSLDIPRTLEDGGQFVVDGCSTKRPLFGRHTIGSLFDEIVKGVPGAEVVATELLSNIFDFTWQINGPGDVRVSLAERVDTAYAAERD